MSASPEAPPTTGARHGAHDASSPAYRAFSVLKREGQDDFWQPLGAAFPHQDGKGYNIVLQALPLDGKIVLREPQAEADADPPAQGGSNARNNRSRRDR